MEYRDIMRMFMDFMHLHRQRVQSNVDEMELYHGQLPILEVVKQNHECTQVEIAELLHISPPSVTNSIKRLEKNGLIMKQTDETDARRTLITITETGDKVATACRKGFDEIDALSFKGLSDEELEMLYEIMKKMIHNLGKEEIK